jgi:hypothetical protein
MERRHRAISAHAAYVWIGLGSLEIIKSRTDQKSVIAMVDRGLESANHGEKLVQHLMAFARQEPLRPEIIDP